MATDADKRSWETFCRIMRNFAIITILTIKTDIPVLNLLPESVEKLLVENLIGTSILAFNFMLHFMRQHGIHGAEVKQYEDAQVAV